MMINGKGGQFHLKSFYQQLKANCTEFGIQRTVIDRYIGQVEDLVNKDTWETKVEELEDA